MSQTQIFQQFQQFNDIFNQQSKYINYKFSADIIKAWNYQISINNNSTKIYSKDYKIGLKISSTFKIKKIKLEDKRYIRDKLKWLYNNTSFEDIDIIESQFMGVLYRGWKFSEGLLDGTEGGEDEAFTKIKNDVLTEQLRLKNIECEQNKQQIANLDKELAEEASFSAQHLEHIIQLIKSNKELKESIEMKKWDNIIAHKMEEELEDKKADIDSYEEELGEKHKEIAKLKEQVEMFNCDKFLWTSMEEELQAKDMEIKAHKSYVEELKLERKMADKIADTTIEYLREELNPVCENCGVGCNPFNQMSGHMKCPECELLYIESVAI